MVIFHSYVSLPEGKLAQLFHVVSHRVSATPKPRCHRCLHGDSLEKTGCCWNSCGSLSLALYIHIYIYNIIIYHYIYTYIYTNRYITTGIIGEYPHQSQCPTSPTFCAGMSPNFGPLGVEEVS